MALKDEVLAGLIDGFEALQKKYRRFGATDTEPDGVFQFIIARAVRGESVKWDTLDFELYNKPGRDAAEEALKAQARKVYDHIRNHGRIADVEELKGYCWRVSV